MSEIDSYRLFIQERLRALDSSISLETGSPADLQVVQPLLRRYGEDPLQVDTELFLKTRLAQKYPDIYLGEGSPFMDIVIKPMRLLLDPLIREIRSIKRNQSLIDPTVLNKDEADALVSNVFVNRQTGDYARVRVRLYFKHPISVTLGTFNVAFTSSGRRFIPVSAQQISSEAMLFNQDGELYYFDASFISEARGSAYNIGPSEISGITGMPAAVRVTNLRAAEQGVDEMTTVALVNWAEQSIGERSLTATPGIVNLLFSQFPSLRLLQVIGFGDAEMQRDVITGGSMGEAVLYGVAGETSDDGDADGYTGVFFDLTADFTNSLGAVGADLGNYVLTLCTSTASYDFRLGEVLGDTSISISDEYILADRIPDNLTGVRYTIRKNEILLSDLPGGLLNPSAEARVTIRPDEIHVGGCTDFYVMGGTNEKTTLVWESLGEETPLFYGPAASTTATSPTVVLSGISEETAYFALQSGRVLQLLSGTDVGIFRVLELSYNSGTSELSVVVDADMTDTDTDILCALFSKVSCSLTNPIEILVEGDDLRTYAGSTLVDTGSGLVWADYGITTSHLLEILRGDDVGIYSIASITGTALLLSTQLKQTEDPVTFRIIRRQGSSLSLPLSRATQVELLDTNLEPTGNVIPYGYPVDVRSSSFQNPGRGAKAGSETDTTDDFLSVTAGSNIVTSDGSVNYYDLGVRPGDIVNILTGNNVGFYRVAQDGVGGSAQADPALDTFQLKLISPLAWGDAQMKYALGSPSYGSFRLYFLNPTLVTVTPDTRISVSVGNVTRQFLPDPEVRMELLPTDILDSVISVTSGLSTATLLGIDGTVARGDVYGLQVGDRVEITYAPIIGSLDHGTSTVNLDGLTLLFDLGDGPERVRFVGNLVVAAMVDQINSQLSKEIAFVHEDSGEKYVGFRGNGEITLLDNSADSDDATALVFGSDPSMFNPWVTQPTFEGQDISNDAPDKGFWYISVLNQEHVTLVDGDGVAFAPVNSLAAEYVVISRAGWQRIYPVEMQALVDDHGLYYCDVECVSEGYGDEWNISSGIKAEITPRPGQGWWLEVADTRFSYSMVEEVTLNIDPFILFPGSTNDITVAQGIIGENIEVSYEKSALVEEIAAYVASPRRRDTTQSPLVRSLFPVFIRTNVTYADNPPEDEARAAWAEAILAIGPSERLEVSDLVALLIQKGSSYVNLPIELVGLAHRADRKIIIERSQDALQIDNLSGFIPDDEATVAGASLLVFHRS